MDARDALRKHVILVTGASGFTGFHACKYFAAQGMGVAALVRDGSIMEPIEGVHYYPCDLLNKERLQELVREIAPDEVLHLGGKNSVPESWSNPLLYMETNIFPTLYLLNALRSFPSTKILVVGSLTAFELTPPFEAPHPYSLSKSLQKAAALSWEKLYGQHVMLAEPSNLIGPGPSTGFCSLLGRHIVATERNQQTNTFQISSRYTRRNFLDVRDAVRAYGMILTQGKSGEMYMVRSAVERTLGDVSELMIGLSKAKVPVTWEEVGETNLSSQRTIESPITIGELEKLGWQASISILSSLLDVLDYYRKEGDSV
ncbi:NAD-dependent epimerase/dehydratase family protein [Paenibacillus pini]|uniref:UDP-2-acetamido-2,6-dideoxy-hexulose 4-reductase n=1 Tax=Paenibacillus pini JCM 16418 TaxID=1236976 RepID=W7Z2N1_9BACL|nr:NAD-dependent epimerase/dehydratase family protein [Paenibacillus pini]GAF08689.1 UDP-2-acetamido-2,6-dideoxy-hexulose 4-reductase [Paenibacillus pini JCM 16418]